MPRVPESLKQDPIVRRQALKTVEHATRRLAKAASEHRTAILFASQVGNSLRDVADAGGVSHQTVKNLVDADDT